MVGQKPMASRKPRGKQQALARASSPAFGLESGNTASVAYVNHSLYLLTCTTEIETVIFEIKL